MRPGIQSKLECKPDAEAALPTERLPLTPYVTQTPQAFVAGAVASHESLGSELKLFTAKCGNSSQGPTSRSRIAFSSSALPESNP